MALPIQLNVGLLSIYLSLKNMISGQLLLLCVTILLNKRLLHLSQSDAGFSKISKKSLFVCTSVRTERPMMSIYARRRVIQLWRVIKFLKDNALQVLLHTATTLLVIRHQAGAIMVDNCISHFSNESNFKLFDCAKLGGFSRKEFFAGWPENTYCKSFLLMH